jgi:hypothetical protein
MSIKVKRRIFKQKKRKELIFYLQSEQIIGQINLFNKYNTTRINDFLYEIIDENCLRFEGLLKIHWNLSKPIQLVSESVIPINFNSIDEESPVSKQLLEFKRFKLFYFIQ